MSIVDWIDETFDGGIDSRVGQLLDVAYNIEYGAESSEQSSLNLVYLLAYAGQGQLRVFGKSNEKYRVRGGERPDSGWARCAPCRPDHHRLAARRDPADGGRALGADVQAGLVDEGRHGRSRRAGAAVLDHARLGRLLAGGVRAPEGDGHPRAGNGTNSKLHVQFASRPWRGLGFNGDTYSDRGYQSTWEVTRAQGGAPGILVDYTGGKVGASFGSGTPGSRARQFLAQAESVLPGLTNAYNGRAFIDFWPANEWTRGSYSFWEVGQYTRFAGMERRRRGTATSRASTRRSTSRAT